jgi:hypothetical protein
MTPPTVWKKPFTDDQDYQKEIIYTHPKRRQLGANYPIVDDEKP